MIVMARIFIAKSSIFTLGVTIPFRPHVILGYQATGKLFLDSDTLDGGPSTSLAGAFIGGDYGNLRFQVPRLSLGAGYGTSVTEAEIKVLAEGPDSEIRALWTRMLSVANVLTQTLGARF
jgi:hypothetical protein